jgi:hypothetical protein
MQKDPVIRFKERWGSAETNVPRILAHVVGQGNGRLVLVSRVTGNLGTGTENRRWSAAKFKREVRCQADHSRHGGNVAYIPGISP